MAVSKASGGLEYKIGIVTVSYGSGDELREFLNSLLIFMPELSKHLVVVDNKPGPDGVAELAAEFQAAYLPLESNPGYGAGMNAGVARLRSEAEKEGEAPFDAYFICNPDVQFIDDAITPLADVLGSDHSVGSVGPKLLNTDGTVYPSARNIPSISTGLGHALFSKVWPRNPWSRAYKNEGDYSDLRDAGWLSGAAVLVRAEVFERLGGFDEGYFMHFEDIDLGYRIGEAGYRNVLVPAATVVHSGAHSTEKHAAVVEEAMHQSAIRFMKKRYAGFWKTPLRLAIIAGLKVRASLKLKRIERA